MQKNYYQNILYPLQDRILELIGSLPVDFYLTGGTALSRVYLNHRFSDDLDFFLNGSETFKSQVGKVTGALPGLNLKFEIAQADEGFARLFLYDQSCVLKLDFINDVPFRSDVPVSTAIYLRTDTPANILSNKLTALARLAARDVVDLVYLSLKYSFSWPEIISEASEKDMWVNAVEVSKIMDEFPLQKLDEINWIDKAPDKIWFESVLKDIIKDILQGSSNSLADSQTSPPLKFH